MHSLAEGAWSLGSKRFLVVTLPDSVGQGKPNLGILQNIKGESLVH